MKKCWPLLLLLLTQQTTHSMYYARQFVYGPHIYDPRLWGLSIVSCAQALLGLRLTHQGLDELLKPNQSSSYNTLPLHRHSTYHQSSSASSTLKSTVKTLLGSSFTLASLFILCASKQLVTQFEIISSEWISSL